MFWPSCHLVRGKPRNSESNGGVERSNRTVEDKLGLWMNENKSNHWSVGLPLVQWEMKTQTHKGIGGKIPYHLFTGQNPRVGISSLPINPKLINKLSTEAQVSALLDLDPDIPLEDAVVKSYQMARISGEVQELTVQPAMVIFPLNPHVAAIQESTEQPAAAIQPSVESISRIFKPPVAKSPDVFCQPVHQQIPVTDPIEDLFNDKDYDPHPNFLSATSLQEGDATTDNTPADIQEEDMVLQPSMESISRIFKPPVAKSPDVFCQPVHQQIPVTDPIEDLFNDKDYDPYPNCLL
jgi:hypothetical protein